MIGHSGFVASSRRRVSSSGSSSAVARPRSTCSAPSMMNTRDHTISPGLETPASVPPPSGKYIGGWRMLHDLS